MNSQLYKKLSDLLLVGLAVLQDKPEETPEATLKTLWCMAAGVPMSVEAAAEQPLPELNETQQASAEELVRQRLSGVPLAHITGRQRFMSLELLAGPEALIPRKETEILGRTAVELLQKITQSVPGPSVVDVCTGAGNIAVAMAVSCPSCKVFASDLSGDAVKLARENAAFLNVTDRVDVEESDLFSAFDSVDYHGTIDLITCNPPYISSAKVPEMDAEISDHEPAMAFDGGPFGIRILHRVIKEAPRFLKKGGWLAFEVGAGQGAAMAKRMEKKYSYSKVGSVQDNNGEIRAVFACNS